MSDQPNQIAALYIGPKQGYLQTGFSFDTICRLGVIEDHPGIMRYLAFKIWLRKAWPTRGTRPAWANRQLSLLSGNSSAAKRAQTSSQLVAYANRHSARETAWTKPIIEARRLGQPAPAWEGDPPPLPRVGIARGRSVALAGRKPQRPVVRPAMGWREQAIADLGVLRELGHKIPRSRWPTQTWWQSRTDSSRGNEMTAVPLDIAYHSWLSCTGRKPNGNPCPYCRKLGKHRSLRALTAGPLEVL